MGKSSKRTRKAPSRDSNDVENKIDSELESKEAELNGYDSDDLLEQDSGGGDDEEDSEEENFGKDDDDMKELEKEYMELTNQQQIMLENLKQHKDEDVLKGQAVKNQKALWDRTLELRFLLQKAFASSNRLPQEPTRSSFCNSDGVDGAYSDAITSAKETLDSILELQEALLENNPSIAQAAEGSSSQSSMKHLEGYSNTDAEGDREWLLISQMHRRIAPFRDKSVNKWQRKTQVMTGAAAMKSKLHAFNQNISEQVSTYMRDPSRMIKQMQQRRSTVGIIGEALEHAENSHGEDGKVDHDPELLDDSEFYHQLLKEFFESIDPTSSEAAFYALKKLQTKKRKVVDRRASKSRKIRYHVHEKIVNFMAPRPVDLPEMAPKLFSNLFGLKTRTTASAV